MLTPMPKPDYSTWYTKQQVADALGVSTKTVQELAKKGRLQQAEWKRPIGGMPLAVYAPDEVDRLAGERKTPKPFVVPAAEPNGNGHALRVVDGDGAAMIQTILRTIQKASGSSERLFLTIDQAADFTGLTAAFIRRKCQDGSLPALKDRGWKIRRSALVAL